VILLVTSQTLIDQGVTMLYGVEADAEDPGPLLLVVPVLVDGEQRWLNVQRGLTRVYRGTLTKSYGLATPPSSNRSTHCSASRSTSEL